MAKKLWLGKLKSFPAETIRGAAEKIIADSEYLPTLHKMLNACRDVGLPEGLPSPRDAYLEACNKPSPKVEQPWTHPAVYLAGRDCGWYFLANTAESKAFAPFSKSYRRYCEMVLAGEALVVEKPSALAETSLKPATPKQAQTALDKLKNLFD